MHVCLTILSQFETLAPRDLAHRNRAYRWDPTLSDPSMVVLIDGEKSEIRVPYLADKRESEFVRSKIAVFVRYVHGLDLYVVRAVAYNGETLEDEELFEVSEVYAEDLAKIGEWVGRLGDKSEGGAA